MSAAPQPKLDAPPPHDRPGLAEWTTADVCDWALGSLKLPEDTVQRLRENEVDGLVLTTLTELDMQTMGIHQLGYRRRLFLGLQGLASNGDDKVEASDAGVLEAADCMIAGTSESAPMGTSPSDRRTRSPPPLPRQVRAQDDGAATSLELGASTSECANDFLRCPQVEGTDSRGPGEGAVSSYRLPTQLEGSWCLSNLDVVQQTSRPAIGTVSKLVGKIQQGQNSQDETRDGRPQALAMRPEETPEADVELQACVERQEESSEDGSARAESMNGDVQLVEADEAMWYEMFDPFELAGPSMSEKATRSRSGDGWIRRTAGTPNRSRSQSPAERMMSEAMSQSDLMDCLYFDPMDLTADIPASVTKRRVRMASDEEDGDGNMMGHKSSSGASTMGARPSTKSSYAGSTAVSEFWQDVSAARAKYCTPKLRLSLSSARERIKKEDEEMTSDEEADDSSASPRAKSGDDDDDEDVQKESSMEPSASEGVAAQQGLLAQLAAIRVRRKQRQASEGLAVAAAVSSAAASAEVVPTSLTADSLRAHERLEEGGGMVQALFSKISEEDPSGSRGCSSQPKLR